MNILHIGKFYPPFHGGMETYLSNLAEAQVQQGHQVTVWVHNHDWGVLKSATTKVTEGNLTIIRQKSLKPVLFAPLMLGFRKQLKQWLKTQTFDLIHVHWPNPTLFAMLAVPGAFDAAVVVGWHSDMVTENSSGLMKLIYRLIRPLETRWLKRADSVLVSSQAYANHSPVLKRFVAKTTVIPLGLKTEPLAAFQAAPSYLEWSSEQWGNAGLKIYHLGRLTFYKNQRMLIEAMIHLPSAHLVLAGGGELAVDLQRRIDRLSLRDRVSLLGAQSTARIHALMSTCDVFCMASNDRAESFGVVLLEAMYFNKPILVPDTIGSGMRWLAESYPKGHIYRVNDIDDFVRKINQIVASGQISDTTAEVPFKFSMTQVAETIERHYTTIIERRKIT